MIIIVFSFLIHSLSCFIQGPNKVRNESSTESNISSIGHRSFSAFGVTKRSQSKASNKSKQQSLDNRKKPASSDFSKQMNKHSDSSYCSDSSSTSSSKVKLSRKKREGRRKSKYFIHSMNGHNYL